MLVVGGLVEVLGLRTKNGPVMGYTWVAYGQGVVGTPSADVGDSAVDAPAPDLRGGCVGGGEEFESPPLPSRLG